MPFLSASINVSSQYTINGEIGVMKFLKKKPQSSINSRSRGHI